MVVAVENSKQYYRQYAKNMRKKINDKETKEKIILNKLLNHPKIKESKNVLVYISTDEEVSTINLITELLKQNKSIYAPKVVGKIILFYKIESLNSLIKGKFNILEPISENLFQNDGYSVIIVPGLLFDKNNNRIGYGGGYYDRFLKDNILYKIGVCFSNFVVDNLECENYDIKMDEIITER